MARSRLTHQARARRYLQASMEAGYTGLPAEHKHAKESLMREHERAYPDVRRHALAGTNRDFDMPLTTGEREHQRYLREKEGLGEGQIQDMRKQLRTNTGNGGSPSARRTSARRLAPAATAAPVLGAIDAAASGKGSLFLQVAGVFIGLSLVYLLVAGKGSKALQGLTTAVTGAVHTFVAPVDPIAKLESALGAAPATGGTSSGAAGGSSASPSPSAVAPGPAGGSSVGGDGPSAWKLHLAPKPSKIKVKVSTPARVRAFEKATGAHFAYGAG